MRCKECWSKLEVQRDSHRGGQSKRSDGKQRWQSTLHLEHGHGATQDHGNEWCKKHPLEPRKVSVGDSLDEVERADIGVAAR